MPSRVGSCSLVYVQELCSAKMSQGAVGLSEAICRGRVADRAGSLSVPKVRGRSRGADARNVDSSAPLGRYSCDIAREEPAAAFFDRLVLCTARPRLGPLGSAGRRPPLISFALSFSTSRSFAWAGSFFSDTVTSFASSAPPERVATRRASVVRSSFAPWPWNAQRGCGKIRVPNGGLEGHG